MTNKSSELVDNTFVKEIENEIEALKNSSSNELRLNDLTRIAESLGVKSIKSKGGSQVRFQSELLLPYREFHEGIFGIHIIHGGKKNKHVRKRDFERYFYPVIMRILNEYKKKVS